MQSKSHGREQTCTLSTRATTLTSAPCSSQAGKLSKQEFQHCKGYQFHLEESLELDLFFQALPPLPFSAPSWECHLGKISKAEIFQGFFPTLDLRYVDKWGRKFGCIVYLIIEALFLGDFSFVCFFFPGICWVS